MTKAFNTIIETLAPVFAEIDAEYRQGAKQWALRRVAAINAFKTSEEGRAMARNQWAYYERLFTLAGGKTWYNAFNGRNDAMIEELMDKNSDAVIAKRNAMIATKLEKTGIIEVVSNEYSRTKDGFDGLFVVNTDKGRKVVTINTIVAGGYNVQCIHNRTLVKVK